MERMGDILARTASRRARLTRPADSAAGPTGIVPPAAPAGPRTHSARPAHRVPPRALPTRTIGPTRSVVGRPLTPPDLVESPPGVPGAAGRQVVPADIRPDVLAGDRILELPPRRAAGAVRASVSAGGDAGGQEPAPRMPSRTSPLGVPESPRRGAPDAARSIGAARHAPGGERTGAPLREPAADYTLSAPVAPVAPALPGRAAAGGSADLCPICGGAGYVRLDVSLGDPAFGKPVPCACKERQIKERERRELDRLSGLDLFRAKTFDTFEPNIQGVGEAFEVARRFAVECDHWLMLSGPYGVGKTHLAAAIANYRLAEGDTVLFSIVPDLLDHLRAAFAPSSEVPYDELFDRIREAGLLVLDDLGAENSTAWATEKLFQLINHRYNLRYPTVITTNARLLSQMDDRIRSRLSDFSLVQHCVIKAQDYRERHIGPTRRPGSASGGGARGGRS